MSRFSKYGALDTQYGEERDSGFIGFNNRIRPDLLKQGILSDSQNGRMTLSGEWQVRKGIDNVTTSLITSTGITLPFTLNDSSAPVLNDSGAARVWDLKKNKIPAIRRVTILLLLKIQKQ